MSTKFSATKIELKHSSFIELVEPLVAYLKGIGFSLAIYRIEQSARILHTFCRDVFEISLSVSEQGDDPQLLIAREDKHFWMNEYIHFKEVDAEYSELFKKDLTLERYSTIAVKFIKSEFNKLETAVEFPNIPSSNNFEAIIDKLLTPSLLNLGFTAKREEVADAGRSFVYGHRNVMLKIVPAGRLDSGDIYVEITEGPTTSKYDYSDLLKRIDHTDDIEDSIACWKKSGFYGGNYYEVVRRIKATLPLIMFYFDGK